MRKVIAVAAEQALKTWVYTSKRSLNSTCIPYETLLEAVTQVAYSARRIKQVHSLVITNGFSSKSVLACRLISSYASVCGIEEARKLFEFLPNRTARAYNHMLKVYVDQGQSRFAFELYTQMLLDDEVLPDPVTFSIILKSCISLRSIREGRILHAHVLVNGSGSDLRLATDILSLYSKCGCISFARKQFEIMPQRDVFAWTAVIDGHLRSGDYCEALQLFRSMRESGLKANAVTWNTLLAGFARDGRISDALYHINLMQADGVRLDSVSLCTILPLFAKFAILKLGLEGHAYVLRNSLELDLFVISALVDMYAKCGRLELARCLFDRIKLKDTGVWNSIIIGYGMHGNCEEALSLLDNMIDSGAQPNEITFTSILSSCSHGGLVTEGHRAFDKMVSNYRIMARQEHYACMVDMFGRSGQLEEAFEVIRNMPFEPTEDIWGAFLNACRIHSDTKLVHIAAQHMLGSSRTGADAGYHVLMSNIYAESGQWGDMAKLRAQIRDAGLKRRTGCSWIEVGDNVYTFNMADMSNPRLDEIYLLLRNLNAVISPNFIS